MTWCYTSTYHGPGLWNSCKSQLCLCPSDCPDHLNYEAIWSWIPCFRDLLDCWTDSQIWTCRFRSGLFLDMGCDFVANLTPSRIGTVYKVHIDNTSSTTVQILLLHPLPSRLIQSEYHFGTPMGYVNFRFHSDGLAIEGLLSRTILLEFILVDRPL